jgi:hypothetical protein
MEHADAMRARGLVQFEGEWMSPGEREARLRIQAAQAAAERENAIADARVAEAEARAREAEARAHVAEVDAARASDYSEGGIPLTDVYGPVYGPGPIYGEDVVVDPIVPVVPVVPVQPCCDGRHDGRGRHADDGRRRYDPPNVPQAPRPPDHQPRSTGAHAGLKRER